LKVEGNSLAWDVRLHLTERDDLLTCLGNADIPTSDFQFRKKSGWLHIDITSRGTSFAFHRKKVTELIDGRFVHSVKFRVRCDGKIQSVDGWTGVITRFEEWLQKKK
jgi:hypothetical protein